MTRRATALLLPLRLLAACSDDGGDTAVTSSASTQAQASTTAAAVETTQAPVDPATAFADAGPYPVGVTTLQLATGPLVEVWYPAVEGSSGSETYDLRDYVPEAVRALLTADIPAGGTYAAGRDAAVADGQFPIVLFSHGYSGVRVQSTFLTSSMASWGMIVVAPEHPSRDLTAVLGGTADGASTDAVDDLLQSLDLIIAAGADPASPFNGHVDAEHVAAVGHSAGGPTVVGAAADDRVDGYVSLASGSYPDREMPAKPSLFVAGSTDGVVSAEQITRPAYEAAPAPSTLWIIQDAGHNAFDDFCTFGNGTGIIGLAEASGLGAFLDGAPQLRTLGEDGCVPPAVPVETTFPIIRHVVTAWVLSLFGSEPATGLGPEVADAYVTPVVIEQK